MRYQELTDEDGTVGAIAWWLDDGRHVVLRPGVDPHEALARREEDRWT